MTTPDQNSQQRQSVMTFATAKALAVATIEELNQSSIKDDISADTAHSFSINQMVNSQLQETIMNKA